LSPFPRTHGDTERGGVATVGLQHRQHKLRATLSEDHVACVSRRWPFFATYNRVSISVDDNDFRSDLRFSFNGPQVYAVLAF